MPSKKKILLIEDDIYLLKIYGNKLRNSNFEVLLATTGEEGLHKILSEKPDLVLLDLILPGKDGFQVLEEMKKYNLIEKIPVIILSNLGQRPDIKRGLELGAVDYLVKANISLMKVVEKINKYLKK